MFKGSSTKEQLELILTKLGTPSQEDLAQNASQAVIDSIRKMPTHEPRAWEGALSRAWRGGCWPQRRPVPDGGGYECALPPRYNSLRRVLPPPQRCSPRRRRWRWTC
jgi:hypothetical protein